MKQENSNGNLESLERNHDGNSDRSLEHVIKEKNIPQSIPQIIKKISCAALITFLSGCATIEGPRNMMGLLPSPTLGTNFAGPVESNPHFRIQKTRSMLYTLKGGQIDLSHLINAANWTIYLTNRTYGHLIKNEEQFSFKLAEPSRYFVEIKYPENWSSLPENERNDIASQISIALGQHFAFTAVTWHEILTWFGYKSTLIFSEYSSAFSWEDSFSNLLGCHVGAKALQDKEHSSDEALQLAIDNELDLLQVQPKSFARQASKAVKGRWYSGDFLFFVSIDKRNFDIGLDGFVTPWVVPEISTEQPQPYPVPNLDCLSRYGFSLKLEIEPREAERNKILRIIYPDKQGNRIQPYMHFAPIMEKIRQQAVKKYGEDVYNP